VLGDHDRVDDQWEPERTRRVRYRLHDRSVAERTRFGGSRRDIFENGLELIQDKGGVEEIHTRYPSRILNRQQGDDGSSIDTELVEGLKVGLEAGPAAGVGPGNGQGNGLHNHQDSCYIVSTSMITRRTVLLLPFPLVMAGQTPPAEKLAPYYPTPETVVEKMLLLGGLKPGEKMFDLGSGDGRVIIMAADKFKADATGIELDDDLHKQSSERIQKKGLTRTARIVHGDVMKQDYSPADLLTVYLLPSSNDKLKPLLEKQLKKGTRIVSHDFEFSGWTPEKVESIDDDGEGRSHTLYLYRR